MADIAVEATAITVEVIGAQGLTVDAPQVRVEHGGIINIDGTGDVVGPNGVEAGRPARFADASGKVIEAAPINSPGGLVVLDGDGTIPDNRIPASIARDSEVTSAISAATAGMVIDTDPRLSDARTPLAHTHPATAVTSVPATTGLDPASTDVEKALTELAARLSGGSAGSVAGSPTAYSGFFVPPGRFQYGDASLVSVSNGTTYYTLGLTPHDITLTAARSRITTATAATVLRRFVCTADASLMPDEMLWQETVDGATTGLRDTTGLAVKIPAGWYLIGCRPEGGNLTIVTVGQMAPSARSNMAAGQSDPGDGMIAAGSGSGVITTPPIPTAIWGINSGTGGSPISMRWSA